MYDPSFLFHSYSHPYHQEMAHRFQIWGEITGAAIAA